MVENTLRMYMVHDGEPAEAAVLVFAQTAREAARIADLPWGDGDSEQFLARRAMWLREPEFAYLRASAQEEGPHTVDHLPSCARCYCWANGPVDEHEICPECRRVEREEAMFA